MTSAEQKMYEQAVRRYGITAFDIRDPKQPYSRELRPCSFEDCTILSHNYIYCPLHSRSED
jgi:hypothetical protein